MCERGRDEMVYIARESKIYIQPVELTKKEEGLLFLLVSNALLSFEEMNKNGFNRISARRVKSRLVQKTGLKIEKVVGVGYMLMDKIYFW